MPKPKKTLPTVVLEIQGGIINCVRSSVAMRVVILDADTEGGDKEKIHYIKVYGDLAYVHDYTLAPAAPGFDGIDPNFVKDVIEQIK